MLSVDAISTHRLAGSTVDISARSATAAAPTPQTDASGQDFGSMLSSLATDAMRSVQSGEHAAMAQLRGTGSLQQTVESVLRAEQSLQAAIAIRDKAVSAYQELSRMAI